MKVLVVYCHPCNDSFNATVRDVVVDALEKGGQQVRLADLYAAGFDPVMRVESGAATSRTTSMSRRSATRRSSCSGRRP